MKRNLWRRVTFGLEWQRVGLMFAGLLLVLLSGAPAAIGEVIRVNSTADGELSGDRYCTLSAAIVNANRDDQSGSIHCAAGRGADTIVFDLPAGPQVINLSTKLPDITADLTINGPGANRLIVMGGSYFPFIAGSNAAGFNIFSIVNPEATVSISGLTITHWNIKGGGIDNQGKLNLTDCTISNNSGFGVASEGELSLTRCLVTNNGGSGINSHGELRLTDCRITNNGWIGVSLIGGGWFTGSTISGNKGGDSGSGIHYTGIAGQKLLLTNCTVSGNVPFNYNPMIPNGQYNHSAVFYMGAAATLEILNSTIVNNIITGYAIAAGTLGSTHMILRNTIIFSAGHGTLGVWGSGATVISRGGNLINDDAGGWVPAQYTFNCAMSGECDMLNTDPMLGPLQDNGGPTPTHQPAYNSLAINNGLDLNAPAVDQRGVPRPLGGRVDIGAVETVPGQPNVSIMPGMPLPPPPKWTPNDFDGDGKADAAVWRIHEREWAILNSRDESVRVMTSDTHYDDSRDVIINGDFDGDGVADPAIHHASERRWRIHRSSDSTVFNFDFGSMVAGLTETPVPDDYDGDGKTDLALVDETSGLWQIRRSSDGVLISFTWGEAGDVPVPGDYDGDGKADAAVYRPSTGEWSILRSSDNNTMLKQWDKWGGNGKVPVPADYDGDGKADPAIWSKADKTWYVKNSSDDSENPKKWETAKPDDVPVPGDYNGDGKADQALWDKTDGKWKIKPSGDNQEHNKTHGSSEDKPVSGKNVR